MKPALETRTSPTLLGRLRHSPDDASAWCEFVDRYGPLILNWCKKRGLQDADSEDITQTVFLKLARAMHTFEYNPAKSFRAWLKTLTHHAWRDHIDGPNSKGSGSGDTRIYHQLESIEAREDLLDILQSEHDRELLRRAMPRVEARVDPKTWQAFVMLTFGGRKGKDAAIELGVKIGAVYVAKDRVQKMLREEIEQLEGWDGS